MGGQELWGCALWKKLGWRQPQARCRARFVWRKVQARRKPLTGDEQDGEAGERGGHGVDADGAAKDPAGAAARGRRRVSREARRKGMPPGAQCLQHRRNGLRCARQGGNAPSQRPRRPHHRIRRRRPGCAAAGCAGSPAGGGSRTSGSSGAALLSRALTRGRR